ncbi:MAG: InlB B-repeat-containing protein, partial [Thermoplasmata archaeon]|nr:InlB B-repeat-containing protein [Thermoplasmata archaeon]
TSDTCVTTPGDSVIANSLEDPNDWVETIDSFYCPLANTYVPCWVGTGYIQYSEPRCLVIYYPNFGDSTRITAQTYTYTNTVERAHWYYEDYTLQGWALEPDGEIVYHSGDEISGFTDRTTPLRLYAVWVSEYYNLTLSTPDGSVTKSYQLKTYAEAPLSTNATLRYFERDGYSIIGWSTDKYATTPEYKVGESYYYLSSGATSITLYPVWQAKTVTVTWQDTDGTVLLQESVAYGTVPSYSGEIPDHDTAETSSTLSGWSQEVTSTVLSWSPVIGEVTEDTVYTAVYTTEVQTHNLTINVNDPAWGYASVTVEVPYGTVVSIIGYEITLTYGDDSVTYIAEPEESTEKYTYYLDHWIVDGVELDEMDGYKVEDDVEITAVFDIAGNSYVVSFDANGGEGTMPVQVMTYGEETELSAVAFTNESYTFVGWATSADGSPVYADSQSVVEVGEVTLYAIWARNTVTVSVSAVNGVPDANLVNAPVGSELVVEDYQVKINGITVVALPEETGDVSTEYRISHWEVDGTEFTGTVTLAADTSVVAVFEEAPATVVIVWCDYDGTILSAEVVDYGTTPVYTGETPTREPTEYIEYEFSGWSEYTTNSGSYLMTAEYTEYTRMYTVTAGMDADDGYGLELLYDIEVPYGADIGVDGTFLFVDGEALVAEISAANEAYTYEFLGWDVEDGSKVTGDMVIVAYYSVIPVEYTVTWTNLDGTVLLEQQVAYGTVPEYTGETPVYVDTMDYAMAFVGWSPSVTEVTGDTEYMAMYSEVYTISFDSAGGFGSMSSVSTARTEDTTLASCSFLRLGYSFAGWATEEGGEIAYMDGAVVTDLGQGGETVTLYAVWEEDSSSYAALAGMAVAILVVIGVAYALVRTYRN